MAVQLAGIPLPGPSDVLGTVRSVTEWSARLLGVLGALPERTEALLNQVETLLYRMEELSGRAEELLERVGEVTSAAEQTVRTANTVAASAGGVIDWANQIADGAGAVVAQVEATSRSANELLGTYQPLAERAAPLARTFVDELSEHEVHAAIALIDHLPELAKHMETDIMPILTTLDRVGPDIHELLAVVKDLRLAINGIPGLAYFRRRGAE